MRSWKPPSPGIERLFETTGLSKKKARSPPQNCPGPSTGAALKEPLLEEHRHGESLRCKMWLSHRGTGTMLGGGDRA